MPRLEKRTVDALYLVGDDELDYAVYCSECGFRLLKGDDLPKDHDLERIMFRHLSEGREDEEFEFS